MIIGWIKLHRSITEHWLYTEKRVFSKFEAWNDILLNVNYSENKITIKGKLYDVKRGQSIMSLETWGKRWNWDKSKVRRFLNLLQKDNMIELKSDTITTRLTVCKYDSYQGDGNADETQMKHKRNADETQMTLIKESKEDKAKKEVYSFDEFWTDYGKPISKKNCKSKFDKLSDSVKLKIKQTLPLYIQSTLDVQFRKHPLTYLNQESWNDEININNNSVAESMDSWEQKGLIESIKRQMNYPNK